MAGNRLDINVVCHVHNGTYYDVLDVVCDGGFIRGQYIQIHNYDFVAQWILSASEVDIIVWKGQSIF